MAKMKPHKPARVKDPIPKSKHKLKRVPNPAKKKMPTKAELARIGVDRKGNNVNMKKKARKK